MGNDGKDVGVHIYRVEWVHINKAENTHITYILAYSAADAIIQWETEIPTKWGFPRGEVRTICITPVVQRQDMEEVN